MRAFLTSIVVVGMAASALPAVAQAVQANAQQTNAPVVGAEPTSVVLVPKDISLVVKTIEGHNSYSASTGQKWHFELVSDVIANGYLIAKAGDDVEGGVQEAQQGKNDLFNYKAANLRIGIDEVHTFCGDTLYVRFDRSEYRRRQGVFGSNKDVTVVKGQEYVPVVSRAQKVCGVATTATPAPIPENAIRTADH